MTPFSACRRGAFAAVFVLSALAAAFSARGREFTVEILSDTNAICRWPAVSDTGVAAWVQYAGIQDKSDFTRSDLYVRRPGAEPVNLTFDHAEFTGRVEFPVLVGDSVYFLGWFAPDAPEAPPFTFAAPPMTDEMQAMENEYPALFFNADNNRVAAPGGDGGGEAAPADGEGAGEGGEGETPPNRDLQSFRGASLVRWDGANFERLSPTGVSAYAPAAGTGGAAFQAARHWPYGYAVLAWTPAGGLRQVTTNYFYALDARINGNDLVFQCWDGNDYEIFLHDLETGETRQLTNNTFDDVAPDVWDGQVVWVAYPVTTSEIFLWKDGVIKKISSGSTENAAPSIWNGHIVWQGVADDGKELDIFYFNGERTIKLTSNVWDDLGPVIRDNLVAWVSYVDMGDAEIMALDLRDNVPVQLTTDGEEDHSVSIGGERIVWQTDLGMASYVRMAVPGAIEIREE